ncbi:MAG: hypothetical protein WC867_06385 [Candidatus Pacearchaeota archaeon]|jgi:hypothetical protein
MFNEIITKEFSNEIERAFEEWSSSEKPVYEATIKPEDKGIFRQIISSNGVNSRIFSKRTKIRGTPIEIYSNVTTENHEPLYFLAEERIIPDNGELFLITKAKIHPGRLTTNTTNLEFTLRTSYADYRNYLNLDWQEVDKNRIQKPLEEPEPIIEIPATPVIIPKEVITETTVKSYSPRELSDLVFEQFKLDTSNFNGDIYRTENYIGASITGDGKFNPSAFTRFTQPLIEYYPLLNSSSLVPIPSIIKGTPLGYSVFLNPDNPNKYLAGIVVFDKVDQNIPRFRATLQTNDKTWMKTQRLAVWKKFQRSDS